MLRERPPDRMPRSAYVNAPGSTGTRAESMRKVTPDAIAISYACPISPKPVTSVPARTPAATAAADAARFSATMLATHR